MSEFRYLEDATTLVYDVEKCIGCGVCPTVCPHGVFGFEEGKAKLGDRDLCIECGACAKNCPVQAISVNPGVGCAMAILQGWITGKEPSCDCGPEGDGSCC